MNLKEREVLLKRIAAVGTSLAAVGLLTACMELNMAVDGVLGKGASAVNSSGRTSLSTLFWGRSDKETAGTATAERKDKPEQVRLASHDAQQAPKDDGPDRGQNDTPADAAPVGIGIRGRAPAPSAASNPTAAGRFRPSWGREDKEAGAGRQSPPLAVQPTRLAAASSAVKQPPLEAQAPAPAAKQPPARAAAREDRPDKPADATPASAPDKEAASEPAAVDAVKGKKRSPGMVSPKTAQIGKEKPKERQEFIAERDPFRKPTEALPTECPPSMPLCRFDRSQLKLVGVIQINEGQFKGMVEDPDGRGYFVMSGMQIGQATVTQVSNKGVTLHVHKTGQDVIIPLYREPKEGEDLN